MIANRPPLLIDGIIFCHNPWSNQWLAVEHATGRVISYDEPTLAAAKRTVREQQDFDPSRTKICSGCNRELALTPENWYLRKTGFRRCKRCDQAYNFSTLSHFMQERLLARAKAAVVDGREN